MQTENYLHTALHDTSHDVVSGKGKNIIPPPERESLWRAYIEKFKDPIIIILLIVFALSVGVAIYEMCTTDKGAILLLEPTGILIALLLATGVGFIFEVKANREFDILNKVKDSRPIKVYRRHGDNPRATISNIPKQDVVVGDIIRLESGDEVPADGTIIEATQLRADESNFTGETYANKYADEADFDKDATYPSNFLLRGSTIIEGNAIMRVTAVGVDTEEGRGVARASEGSDVETPLNRQLAQLGRWISIASFIIATLIIVGRVIVFLVANSAEGADPSFIEVVEFVLGSVMIAVTLIVVAVPEGLPMSITVSLA
ncbi:MAG: haloacid dehalogenase, partial [Alistipes sp.]|nr:haloacid dehalogenase [Alistipes sp.]